MKYYSMKNTYLVVCGMLACFTSCSTDSDMLADGAGDNIGKVESVKFEIKTEWKEPPASNRSGEDIFTDENVSDLLLDAFIVQKKDNDYWLLSNNEDKWMGNASEGYILSKNLELGQYHFSLLKGMKRVSSDEEGNGGSFCYMNLSTSLYGSLSDLEIMHPYSEKNLKDCNELFLEENSGHFSDLVNLAVNSDGVNKHEFSANLTHAQARVDVIVVKATQEIDGSYKIEDVNPFQNGKISDITLAFEGVNNVCRLSDLSFMKKDNVPASYMKPLSAMDFSNFDYESYRKGFEGNDPFKDIPNLSVLINCKNLKIFCGGIYLFPTESAKLTLTMNYNPDSGLNPSVLEVPNVRLDRNKVRLIVVWLLNEKFVVIPNVDVSNELPEYAEGITMGDEGVWN